jgi:hypothetical protein
VEEAVEKEARRWKDRLTASGQESDDLRYELQQTLLKYPITPNPPAPLLKPPKAPEPLAIRLRIAEDL